MVLHCAQHKLTNTFLGGLISSPPDLHASLCLYHILRSKKSKQFTFYGAYLNADVGAAMFLA